MPRRAGQSSINAGPLDTIRDELGIGGSRNAGSGYEPEKVCTHCLGMLQGELASSVHRWFRRLTDSHGSPAGSAADTTSQTAERLLGGL